MRRYNFCTMIGNPSYYGEKFRRYDAKGLAKLKTLGADTVLVNIAWSRPYIDAVILEHVAQSREFPAMSDIETVVLRNRQLKERVKNVHKSGMRAIGLFGIPIYTDYSKLPPEYSAMLGSVKSTVSVDNVTCILSEATLRYYKELITIALTELKLDGVLIYTYDELAEVCDEDSDCPRCKNIPLEERLPGFLNKINAHCKSINSEFELWWEPWELSAAQVYLCLEKMDAGIAVSCHSTLHEVYHINHPDVWVRNVGMLCKEQGRKMIIEMFLSGSGEELGPVAGYPCPRLIYEQIKALELVEGVTGIKEYYGMALPFVSVNEETAALALKTDDDYERTIRKIAAKFSAGAKEQSDLIEAWSLASRALLMTPWDMSWVLRFSNLQPYDRAFYGEIHFKDTMKTPWTTPSWQSNRRSYYLIVDGELNLTPHMWRDFDKRMKLALGYARRAMEIYESAGMKSKELALHYGAIKAFYLILAARRNYMNLCNMLVENKNGADNEKQIRALLGEELKNAHGFIAHFTDYNGQILYDAKKSEEGAAFIEKILASGGAMRENFNFLKYC